MIRAAALACVLSTPLLAQDMTPEVCRDGWQAFNQMIGEQEDMTSVQPDVTATGWCRVDSRNANLNPNDFASLEFRGTGLSRAVANEGAPEALDVRIEGIDLIKGWKLPLPAQYAGPRGTAQLSYIFDPDTHDVALETLEADFGGLGHLKVTANGGGVDLASLKTMQITLGGARVNELTLQFQATPALKQAMLPDIAAAMGDMFVRSLPDTSIDPASRAALSAFLASGPDAGGLLRLDATSEAGMGFLQMVGGAMPLKDKGMSPETLTSAMQVMFSGVTLQADWVAIE